MTRKITQNLLTKYIYNEANSSEILDVENALSHDYELREKHTLLVAAKNALPKVEFSPPTALINNILNYSNSTHLEAQL